MSTYSERNSVVKSSQARRWALPLGTACLLAIATFALWRFDSGEKASANGKSDAAANVTVQNGAPQTASHKTPSPPNRPIPSDVKAFGLSQNLAGFVADHVDVASRGDGAAGRLIANAYEECKQLTADPRRYAEGLKSALGKSINAERSAAFDAAIEREQKRCNGLIGSSSPANKEVSLWFHGAATNGDLAAQIRLARSSQDSSNVVEFQSKLVASADGAAMSEFGASLSDLSADERQTFGGISADRLSGYAWALAACEFGEDCSAAGEPLRTLCLRVALCNANRLEDAYRELLSPVDFENAWRMRSQIVEAVKRGDEVALTEATH